MMRYLAKIDVEKLSHTLKKTIKIWTKPKTQTRKINHKKCKPKSNTILKTQRHKIKTWYMLEDDSNIILFW
jgi:hypothetical protein